MSLTIKVTITVTMLTRRPLFFVCCDSSISILYPQRASFDERRAQLRKYVHDTHYAIGKDRMRADLEKFLHDHSSLPPPLTTSPSISEATPQDVLRFLHKRDKAGRTQVHVPECGHMGAPGLHGCGCPKHLAFGTLDSYIGQIRAIFNAAGRLGRQNPCDSADVKDWLRANKLEQQRHRVPVKQAKPTFSTHIRLLVKEIMLQLANLPADEPLFPRRYPLLRDWVFFLVQWFSGDRAGDLGNSFGREVVRLEDGSLLFNHTVGKTIRSAAGDLLVVPPVPEEPFLCPVAAFDRFVAACSAAGLDLRSGYLFRPLCRPLGMSARDVPFSSNAATRRLRFYLPDSDLTAHGSRAGCAITLLMLGASPEYVKDHCRWPADRVFKHYTQLDRVRRLDESARVLQSAVRLSDGVSDADSAAYLYQLLNDCNQAPAIV